MPSSPDDAVQSMYEQSAESYSGIMDEEIQLPLYADALSRLKERIAGLAGPVVDTSCGPGHMLSMYHEQFDRERALVGIDLTPRMVELAEQRLGSAARVVAGDMRQLDAVADGAAAAIVSYFSIHHLDRTGVADAFSEWSRALRPQGQLLLAVWEGEGEIDYGEEATLVAYRYGAEQITAMLEAAGFVVDRCAVEAVEEIPMDAIYLEATRG